jgi:hypothetical protein
MKKCFTRSVQIYNLYFIYGLYFKFILNNLWRIFVHFCLVVSVTANSFLNEK